MSLPELAVQMVYGRLAWAVVLAAVVVAIVPGPWRSSRRLPAIAFAGCLCLMVLPGQLSAAYWLGLAFQYPSGLLAACCLLKLFDRRRGERGASVMPPGLAGALAVAGAALYLDAFGLTSQGYYYAGFGATGVPVLVVLASAACAFAIVRGRGLRQAVPLLGAVLLFSLLRLPTGNFWDAILDPLLWGWALATLVRSSLRKLRRLRAADAAQLEQHPGLATELPRMGVAGIEHYSTSKEHVSGK